MGSENPAPFALRMGEIWATKSPLAHGFPNARGRRTLLQAGSSQVRFRPSQPLWVLSTLERPLGPWPALTEGATGASRSRIIPRTPDWRSAQSPCACPGPRPGVSGAVREAAAAPSAQHAGSGARGVRAR